MSARRISHTVSVASIVLAPVCGIVAAVATPALVSSSMRSQLVAIAHHPERFYLYALFILLSSFFFVPAIAAITRLMPEDRPAWTEVAYLLTQVSMLVALGDAATEMVWWKAASPGASLSQMAALSDRLEGAPGYGLIYAVGGLSGIVGTTLLAVALIRTHAAPAWASLSLPVGFVVNIVGFSVASHATLVISYVVLTAGAVHLAGLAAAPGRRPAASPPAAPVATGLGGQSAG